MIKRCIGCGSILQSIDKDKEGYIDKEKIETSNYCERCFRIRYNVFKYCTTDICATIDGSIKVKGSLDKLIDKFNNGKWFFYVIVCSDI